MDSLIEDTPSKYNKKGKNNKKDNESFLNKIVKPI